MHTPTTRLSAAGFWTAAGFCALLGLMKLLLGPAADPAFYCFLPMCFVYWGLSQAAAWKRVDALEQRIAALEGRSAHTEQAAAPEV